MDWLRSWPQGFVSGPFIGGAYGGSDGCLLVWGWRAVDVAIAQESGRERFYAAKVPGYFSGGRADFVARLPVNADGVILEVGCGSGETGALAIAAGKARYYAGVELSREAAEKASGRLSEVVVGDVEELDLPWAAEHFDAVILSEVLEHLVDPWSVVNRVVRLVKPGGLVLASSPNIAHWRVVRELFLGRFELADAGVFDRTHMRWFTPSSFGEMFERGGVEVMDVGPVTPFAARTRLLSALSGGWLDHLFMTQIRLEGRRR